MKKWQHKREKEIGPVLVEQSLFCNKQRKKKKFFFLFQKKKFFEKKSGKSEKR
jgi:hypothetical protein